MSNQQANFWFAQNFGRWQSWLIAALIAIASLRGFIVLHFELPASSVYAVSAISLIGLSMIGFLLNGQCKFTQLSYLRQLLLFNAVLGILYIVFGFFLRAPTDLSLVYVFLAPYVIFLLLQVSSYHLIFAFSIIAIGIGGSVFHDFLLSLHGWGSAGAQQLIEYSMKLRPDTVEGLGHNAKGLYRPFGYTGSYHDSANILGLLGPFFLIHYFIGGKWLNLVLAIFSLFSLMLTQSAANIIVALVVSGCFSIYVLFLKGNIRTICLFLLAIILVVWLVVMFSDVIGLFTERVGPEGDWSGMKNQLTIDSFLQAAPFFFVGHADVFQSEILHLEIALLKGIFQFGIVHMIILCLIWLYPVLCFFRIKPRPLSALPSVAALVFGFMSLLHYGSLLRVTSIYLFYALYAVCLNEIFSFSSFSQRYVLNSKSSIKNYDSRY